MNWKRVKNNFGFSRQLMIAQLQAELKMDSLLMVCGSLDHPKVDGTQADEAALGDLMDQVENFKLKRKASCYLVKSSG